MTELITHLGAYAAFFGIIDMMLSREAREKVSLYIFGFERSDFPQMEHHLVVGLVDFILPSRVALIPFRLYLVSFLLLTLCFVLLVSITPQSTYRAEIASGVASTAGLALRVSSFIAVFSIFSIPTDFVSAKITRVIFCRKKRPLITYPLWILVDVVASLTILLTAALAFYFICVELFGIKPVSDLTLASTSSWAGLAGFALAGLLVSSVSIFFLSIVQCLALFIGGALRILSQALKLNLWIALNSDAHRFPFTFMGLLTGCVVAAIWGT